MKIKEINENTGSTRNISGFPVFPISAGVDEAVKLNAPHKRLPKTDVQDYLTRIKTGTKTKQDKFAPIVHASNIKAIIKSEDPNDVWDLDDLAEQIKTRPASILGTNAKMSKSADEGEIVYDITLPALAGLIVDEDNGDFVQITTCPGAGECQLFCYARKGGYIMFPASSMSSAQALNFLINDPTGYMNKVQDEITAIKKKTDKKGIELVVRWHDAGDFFSKEYLNLAYSIAKNNPTTVFYAYTKIADVVIGAKPKNFIMSFSSGAKPGETKKIELYKQAGNVVKQGITVPKDMFYDLIARDGNKLIKDSKGRTQFKNKQALEQFKDRLASEYGAPRNTIITYDEILKIPKGNKPKWNVIVQPGAGDRAAYRLDVIDSYLMEH
ncbi:MAG: GP88 family protein [Flavobacteriales bacterium]